MSSASNVDKKPIVSKRELVKSFEKACTPPEKRLIGVEHEKPPFYLNDNAPVTYDGDENRKGVRDFIQKMIDEKGWEPGEPENEKILDLHRDNASWTFEPGLQMETGGAPLKNVHQSAAETDEIIREGVDVAQSLGFGMLAMGYHPTIPGERMPEMPKSRYGLLREYIKAHNYGGALDLMACTSTTQVNMGYTSEENMVKMLRVSLSLQPIAVSLFANSPFSEGKLTDFQSYRSHKLHNNFGGRYGFMLPIAFDEGFGFEMFTDYAMKTMPVMGVYKGNVLLDGRDGKFVDFMKGKLSACKGQKATMSDWQNHLNTIWPEVRVRRFLEMRGADNGPAEMIKALPAFWTGLLYDEIALDQAYQMVKDWSQQDRDYLRAMTPNTGLQTRFNGEQVQDVAIRCLMLSQGGLKRRGILNEKGQDESVYLDPLFEIAASGLNWAQRNEHRFRNEWNGDISRLFNAMSYANEPSVLKVQTPSPAARRIILPPDSKL
jgi:glutamate--cysteine ligase